MAFQSVEIPGYREQVRKERTLRDRAFLGGNEIVFGIEVKQLSLRTALFLEHAENGFMIPVRWDFDGEEIVHAIQVLWFAQPDWVQPSVTPPSIWRQFNEARRQTLFARRVLRNGSPDDLVTEVMDWIKEAMFDCPAASGSEVPRPSYVSHPAHLVDLFGAAGLTFSYDEILDMPLKRLWQHYKLAANRLHGLTLTNPSDDLAVEHLARGGA